MTWQLRLLEEDIAECMANAMMVRARREEEVEADGEPTIHTTIALQQADMEVSNAMARRDHFIMCHSHNTG